MEDQLVLREIRKADCREISNAFRQQGWDKPESQYEAYFELQTEGKRDVIVAELAGEFVGYVTIKWESDYLPFKDRNIPEIVDFNVLKRFQRKGIGTQLMDEAERRIKSVSSYAGIGVGVFEDYGPAQILYVKRGYIPDGKGIVKHSKPIQYGEQVIIGDDIILYSMKAL